LQEATRRFCKRFDNVAGHGHVAARDYAACNPDASYDSDANNQDDVAAISYLRIVDSDDNQNHLPAFACASDAYARFSNLFHCILLVGITNR
jgi:hypothetical protein